MTVTVTPAAVGGRAEAPGSKSYLHRLLICAALADGETEISGVTRSEDIDATARCLEDLGASLAFDAEKCRVRPAVTGKSAAASGENLPELDCGESGSTLRFLMPVAAAVCGGASFRGAGRLAERPIADLVAAMRHGGVEFSAEKLPLTERGWLRAGDYLLPGDVSSQYVSGLLMALSVVEGKSRILLSSVLESAPYVRMTLHTLREFGAEVCVCGEGYAVRGRASLSSPGAVRAEGDWSNAAFLLALGALCGRVEVSGLSLASEQGDREVLDILRRFGAEVETGDGFAAVSPGGGLHGCEIALGDIPDLLPVLAVVAANAQAGEVTRFTGAARLRLKESDRIHTVAELIRSLGGQAEELPDGLVVAGGGLRGGRADGAGDHRIVMSAAVAAARCEYSVEISGAEAVAKSYPRFFRDYRELGGRVYGV